MQNNGQPRIVKKQFNLVGVGSFVKWGDDFKTIMEKSIREFQSRINEIKNPVNLSQRIKYFYSENGMRDGFNYMECVEVKEISDVTEGFISRAITESEYAVFIAEEGKGGNYARHTWLPRSGYVENFNVMGDLEIKDEDKNICEFWLPIKRG